MIPVNAGKERRQKRTKAVSSPTGIPEAVQAKFEAASGLSFEDVRVHYNSPRPEQLGAYAYTQGSQVYIGPGQERHLEHELGHVIQQKQGIVKADGYINGVPVNRDQRLEQAADLGANQPVQGFWRNLSAVVQMAPPGEEEEKTVNGFTTKIHEGRQGKHIVGHQNYIEGRSILSMTLEDAQGLMDAYAGTGEWIGDNKERVNFGRVIGKYKNPQTDEEDETMVGIIHYSGKGAHIVPARPT